MLCIGAGGLGSPLALYLAAAGVGTLGIVDFDVVDYTNLQRQIMHATGDVGRKKLDSAAENCIAAINPNVEMREFETRLTSANALEIFATSTSSSTAPTISPRAIWSTTPACCWASPMFTDRFSASKGRPASSPRKDGPCYRCLYPEPPPPGVVPSAPRAACWAFCRDWLA